MIGDLKRDLVQAISAISLQCLDEGLEMPSLPVRKTFFSQSILFGVLFLCQRLGCMLLAGF